MKKIYALYLARFFLIAIFAIAAPYFFSYRGFFPYKEILDQYSFPFFIKSLASFDGLHYMQIAKNGYSQYEQAFFPAYPLSIRFISGFLSGNFLLSGLLISNISFLLGLVFFYQFLKKIVGNNAFQVILLLVAFPTAFFFSALYTESIFFFFFSACLYYLKEKKFLKAAFFAAIASATRFIGFFLVIPFLYYFFKGKKENASKFSYVIPLLPLTGLLGYMTYLYYSIHDPLAFINSQPAFGANRSSSIITLPQVYFRYIKIFLTSDISQAYFVAVIEFIIFTFVFLVCLHELWRTYKSRAFERMALAVFSIINIVLPTLTGTFSSIPRYALFSVSFFLALGSINHRPGKIIIGSIFIGGQIILLMLFVQGYFIG